MKIPTLLLAALMLFLSQFVHATDTVSGTSTTGTQTIAGIASISIIPANVVLAAGESIQFVVSALNTEGFQEDVVFSPSDGSITSGGIFTSTKAGRATVVARQGEVSAVAIVTVIPASPHRIEITSPSTFVYGEKYPSEGLFTFQVFDKYNNEILADEKLAESTIKKNTPGNLLGRLVNAGGLGINSQYSAMLRPVLIGGYVSELGQILFFERGAYTVTVEYGDIVGTKEFSVVFREPYSTVEAWEDYHMGELNLDNRVLIIRYDIGGGITKVIPLQGGVYDDFYSPGLMCKFYAICEGHYHILDIRQELIEQNSKKAINKAFMLLISPQGVK